MTRPIRILHVVSEMGPTGGGVEVWLLQVLRHIDRDQFRMDFLVHTNQPRAFDEEVRSLGSRVLSCVRPLHLWKYPFDFRRVLRQAGPYDIVHSHTLFGGLVMRLAQANGVPVRIAHSHSDVDGFRVDGDLLRGPFVRYTNRWARRSATRLLACSRKAGEAMFGANGTADCRVLYYGIDLTPFEGPVDRNGVRAELGIPAGAIVIGHVGRFQAQKNHTFLIDIAVILARRLPEMRLVLVGDGPLRTEVEQKVRRLGLTEYVRFLGVRRDIARLMIGAMDAFVLPSHYEGLPLVGIEAQAAGLPGVVSDTITEELHVVPGLIQRMSLSQPASDWADAVVAAHARRQTLQPMDALAAVKASPFNIRNAVRALENVYRESMAHPG